MISLTDIDLDTSNIPIEYYYKIEYSLDETKSLLYETKLNIKSLQCINKDLDEEEYVIESYDDIKHLVEEKDYLAFLEIIKDYIEHPKIVV